MQANVLVVDGSRIGLAIREFELPEFGEMTPTALLAFLQDRGCAVNSPYHYFYVVDDLDHFLSSWDFANSQSWKRDPHRCYRVVLSTNVPRIVFAAH